VSAATVVETLVRAHLGGPPAAAPSATLPGLDAAGAYALQEALVERLVADGATPIGWKVGMASAVGREPQTPGPIYGRLLDGMLVDDGGTVEVGGVRGVHAEGEIAFVMGADLRGPAIAIADVLDATAGVRPAIELFATRLAPGRSTVADSIADNSGCAHVVLGGAQPVAVDGLDLRLTGLVLRRGDEIAGTGAGAQVLGHPAAAVAWLARALHERGQAIASGDVVISGAVAGAHAVQPGDRFVAEVDRLGRAEVGIA
jgi:2-keto-4-pentenoate hydratase